jgi:tRNA(adenine34) deaminase
MNAFLNEALELAHQAAQEDEVPVGAVVVWKGRVIGRGYNQRERGQDPLAHAELIALRDASLYLASWRLQECQLYCTLEPCLMCLAASQQARIQEVFYGAQDLKGGALSLGYCFHQDQRINHRFQVQYLPSVECGEILTQFFKKKRQLKV